MDSNNPPYGKPYDPPNPPHPPYPPSNPQSNVNGLPASRQDHHDPWPNQQYSQQPQSVQPAMNQQPQNGFNPAPVPTGYNNGQAPAGQQPSHQSQPSQPSYQASQASQIQQISPAPIDWTNNQPQWPHNQQQLRQYQPMQQTYNRPLQQPSYPSQYQQNTISHLNMYQPQPQPPQNSSFQSQHGQATAYGHNIPVQQPPAFRQQETNIPCPTPQFIEGAEWYEESEWDEDADWYEEAEWSEQPPKKKRKKTKKKNKKFSFMPVGERDDRSTHHFRQSPRGPPAFDSSIAQQDAQLAQSRHNVWTIAATNNPLPPQFLATSGVLNTAGTTRTTRPLISSASGPARAQGMLTGTDASPFPVAQGGQSFPFQSASLTPSFHQAPGGQGRVMPSVESNSVPALAVSGETSLPSHANLDVSNAPQADSASQGQSFLRAAELLPSLASFVGATSSGPGQDSLLQTKVQPLPSSNLTSADGQGQTSRPTEVDQASSQAALGGQHVSLQMHSSRIPTPHDPTERDTRRNVPSPLNDSVSNDDTDDCAEPGCSATSRVRCVHRCPHAS